MIEKCGLSGKYDLKITDINDEAHGWADLIQIKILIIQLIQI